jgi:aldehyde reductase
MPGGSRHNFKSMQVRLASGHLIPRLGFGTWRGKPGQVGAAVERAIGTAGFGALDCASVYGNQAEVGAALRRVFDGGRVRRAEVFITSKLWCTDAAPSRVEAACRKTLSELGLQWLDMFMVHWPVAFRSDGDPYVPTLANGDTAIDEDVSLEDTWRAMEALVGAGLTRSLGVCNFSPEDLERVLHVAKIAPSVNQVECHPYLPQHELRRVCAANGIAVQAYSPLATLNHHSPPRAKAATPLLEHPSVRAIATRLQRSPAQVLIRWNLQAGNLVLTKSDRPERITENANVFDFELSASDMAELDRLGRLRVRVLNPVVFRGPRDTPFFAEYAGPIEEQP